ncbi:MAG: type III-A CRISPR-associated protein Csm2, partial [Bacteroidota bacterium]|nr:type III-A CRISPR-associated protein Csm2 [Bacteroidota bacterium]
KSQIRNIFGEIRRIETLNADIRQVKFLLLLPKLAYSVAKSQKNLKPYRDEFEKWYNVVNEGVKDDTFGKRFDNFVNFFESFLAFHRVVAQKD